MTTCPKSPPAPLRARIAATAVAVVAAALLLPALATASTGQISIMQDDATFLDLNEHDQEAAMAEAKALGVDVVRVFVNWQVVSPANRSRKQPAGFDVGDPDSPGYNWDVYDAFVDRARRNGLKVMLTLAPPIPWWASEEPRRCPHRIGGYAHLALSCMWKPKPSLFAQFAKAAARRYGAGNSDEPYGGNVAYWSLFNEPNLEHYVYPQLQRTRFGMIDVAAARYRQLWIAGQKAIAKYDPTHARRVLFGETAAISSPLDTLYAALCLDPEGEPFKGRVRMLQGCGRPRKLPIGGLAVHPYNNYAIGSVFTRSATKDSLPMAYLTRAHKLLDRAARHGRVPRGRGIYITEFGFQSAPPDPFGDALSLPRQAAAINEADRLFYADPRVKSIAQYELYDVPEVDDFNTGLRLADGEAKPAFAAYRMPLVVTKLAPNRVEVWGQVRPATARVRPEIAISGGVLGGSVIKRPFTNAAGYYRFIYTRRNAAKLRYRATWIDPLNERLRSRAAAAGKPIQYRE